MAQDTLESGSNRENMERRLSRLREQAQSAGVVEGKGALVPGAPFPWAAPDSGYYGLPLLKEPQWRWQIPAYFFVGGAAGSAAVLGAVANWAGADLKIVRDARLIAASGAIVSSALLIADLGKPEKFLNMLRVFKWRSPMSVGAWVLAAFGASSGMAALAQIVRNRTDGHFLRAIETVSGASSALFGFPFSNYTGVLIGATVIPVWNHFSRELPVHFGMSGLNSAVALLELSGNDRSTQLNCLGIGAAAAETYVGIRAESTRSRVAAPLKQGASGALVRAGAILSGPVPLALRLSARLSNPSRSRRIRRWAAWSSIAGSLLTRYGWLQAGRASARDWRLPLEIAEPSPLIGPAAPASSPVQVNNKPS